MISALVQFSVIDKLKDIVPLGYFVLLCCIASVVLGRYEISCLSVIFIGFFKRECDFNLVLLHLRSKTSFFANCLWQITLFMLQNGKINR